MSAESTKRSVSLVKNTLIIAFGKLSTQFLTFLLLPLYTTYLATSEFGTVDLVMTYVTLLAPIITVSLEMGVFRFLIDVRGDAERQKRIISTVVRFTACMLALATVAYLLVWSFVNIPYGLYALGATVAVIMSNMFLQIARGFGDNVKFAVGGMVAGVTTIAANILFIVVMGIGARGMLTSTILANVACAIYLFVALKLYRYIDFRIHDRKLLQQLLGYSAPLVPNGASWWAINAADRTIVAIFLGVAANGVYAAAYRFPLVFNGLFSFFSMSWTESASVHINSPDRDTFFSRTMNAGVKLFGSLGLVMLAGLPIVFNLFVGTAFREAYLYIPLLIVGSFFNSIVGLYSALYIAKKMTKQVMNTSVIAAVVSVVVSLVGIRFVGLYAPAAAMAVAFFAMAVYRHYDMKKYIAIRYEAKTFVVLMLLYAAAITLYYMNTLAGNIANVVIIGAAALALNRSVVAVLWKGVLSKGRVLASSWRR
jgi:hypothetical protein